MKRRSAPVVLVILLIIVLLGAGLVYFYNKTIAGNKKHIDPTEYFGDPGNEGKLIVSSKGNSNKTALEENGLFIDFDTVRDFVNDKFYYDGNEGTVTVTGPAFVETVPVTGNEELVKESDGTVYLSLDFIRRYSDIEVGEYDDPARIVVLDDPDMKRILIKDSCFMRREAEKRSYVIRDLTPEDDIFCLGSENGFFKAMTRDGFTGYISTEDVAEVAEAPERSSSLGEYTSLSFDHKLNMVFHQADSQAANNALLQSLEGVSGINVIAPTWYYFNDTDGTLKDLSSDTYVSEAHDLGLMVFGVVNDFDGELSSDAETLETLKSTAARKNIIGTLISSAKEKGIDGINVDLEHVNEECAVHYIEFIRELSAGCRENGLVLSVDTYVPQRYNAFYDRRALAEVADYIVTMAYDEHHPGSPEAGSVSSISWVKEALSDIDDAVPKEKTIIALPFYTRLWETDSDDKIKSTAMGMGEAEGYVTEHSMLVKWDEEHMQNYASIQDGGVLYEIWLEDGQSIKAKMETIGEYDIAGVAEWKLGLEKSEIWAIIGAELNK